MLSERSSICLGVISLSTMGKQNVYPAKMDLSLLCFSLWVSSKSGAFLLGGDLCSVVFSVSLFCSGFFLFISCCCLSCLIDYTSMFFI